MWISTCRAAAGVCDALEQCDEVSNTCPNDRKVAPGTECRPAAGLCDVRETCDGVTNECPADGLRPAGAVCRSALGPCGAAEQCTGRAVACPEDASLPDGTPCRFTSGICQSGLCRPPTQQPDPSQEPVDEDTGGCRVAGAPPQTSAPWSLLLLLLAAHAARRRTRSGDVSRSRARAHGQTPSALPEST